MYSRTYGIESDGELFKMQQEAIKRAKEMSQSATLPPPEKVRKPLPEPKEEALSQPEYAPLRKKKKKGTFNDLFSNLFSRLNKDDILLIVLLIILISEDADDDIILIIGFLLIAGFLN